MNRLLLLTGILLFSKTIAQNVGINANGAAPNNSAMLDVDVSALPINNKKGVLIPRIALASATDAATIPSPATSLLVYNTGTGGLTPAGYYYNAGTPGSPNWVRLMPATGVPTFCGGITANYVQKWTGTQLCNSIIYDNGINVGINTASPAYLLHVNQGAIAATSTGGNSSLIRSSGEVWANHDIFVYHTSFHPAFVGLRGRGTASSPAYPQLNDNLVTFVGRDVIDGYSSLNVYGGAEIAFFCTENWTSANKGAGIKFSTTINGSNTITEKMRLTQDGNLCINITSPSMWYFKLDVNGWITSHSDYGDLVYIGGDNAGNDAEIGIFSSARNNITFYNRSQSIQSNCYAQNFISTSDTTLKENIHPLSYGIKEIMKLHPIFFNYKKGDNGRKRMGLIAQEVKTIMPELIDEKENLYMHYLDYTAVLTKAIQEQQQTIEQLKKENEQLKQQNQNFSAELLKIKQHIGLGEAKK